MNSCNFSRIDAPEKLITDTIGELKIINDFVHMSNSKKNYSVCLVAVNINGNMLQHVPEIFKNCELCLVAIIKNPEAFEYIPLYLRNNSLFMIDLIRANPNVIRSSPKINFTTNTDKEA